jgi:hypothetical protein
MHASEVTPEAIERANELYWHSDRSVNQIAEDLELSKGTLYGILEPEPSGLGCPLCGDEVGYANRTAKDRGALECPTCSWDGDADEASAVREPGSRESAAGDEREQTSLPERSSARAPAPPSLRSTESPSLRTIAGGALLGAAAGLALVMWARRR